MGESLSMFRDEKMGNISIDFECTQKHRKHYFFQQKPNPQFWRVLFLFCVFSLFLVFRFF